MINKKAISKKLAWLDNNILLIIGGFLIAFIPLYPKLPLFEAIPGYIVRVRLEDMLILLAGLVWLVQLLRKKTSLDTPLTKIVIAYGIVGLLSTISAVLITKTVPMQPLHIGKTLLHYFRYLEYFSLFFILFSAVKTKKDLRVLLTTIFVTLIGVGIYGLGQKYFYWPVYSTMNREFSKGIRLYLTEHARVQSTFGGHYDLAGYLVVILPIVMAFLYSAKRRKQKIALWSVFLIGLWLLYVSASRTSFLAFLVAALIVIVVKSFDFKTWRQRIVFALRKGLVFSLVMGIMMIAFGGDMYDRLLQSMEGYPAIYKPYIQTTEQTSWLFTEYLPEKTGINRDLIDRIKEGKFTDKPENALSTQEAEVLVASDQQPTQENPNAADRPSDVYTDIPDKKTIATKSADGTITYTEIEVPRTYSENARRHGLSLAIRLDALWPRAIAGFYSNPLLGSGYATLTKETVGQFTEAESTDNNFLRTLGETGLLGFVTFYGAVAIALYTAVKIWKKAKANTIARTIAVGFLAATIGILLNATYIDVFAASKVAFTYWGVAGIVLAIYSKDLLSEKKDTKHEK